jgi:hypothetical protein
MLEKENIKPASMLEDIEDSSPLPFLGNPFVELGRLFHPGEKTLKETAKETNPEGHLLFLSYTTMKPR